MCCRRDHNRRQRRGPLALAIIALANRVVTAHSAKKAERAALASVNNGGGEEMYERRAGAGKYGRSRDIGSEQAGEYQVEPPAYEDVDVRGGDMAPVDLLREMDARHEEEKKGLLRQVYAGAFVGKKEML